MVDSFINKQKSKLNGYNVSQCLRMFGVSDSGYYAWKGRKEDIFGKQAEKKADRDAIKELVNPCWVAYASKLLEGSSVKVCTVIGFPLGANDSAVKAFEAKTAIKQGASEVDMVINIGKMKVMKI